MDAKALILELYPRQLEVESIFNGNDADDEALMQEMADDAWGEEFYSAERHQVDEDPDEVQEDLMREMMLLP